MQLLLGCDPELFLRSGKKNISAHDVGIPGTKAAPFKVGRGALQIDGTALEFNIEPAASQDEWLMNIDDVLAEMKSMLPRGMKMDIKAVVHYAKEYMDGLPLSAKLLGCDPDYNAYTAAVNNAPDQHPTMRTAAGHVHLGWTNNQDPLVPQHFSACCTMVKELDLFLGIPSVILDEDIERKEMYGKAGAFRPKPYGVEYRVLSNFWLTDINLKAWVWNATNRAFDNMVTKGKIVDEELSYRIEHVINSNDKVEAKKLIETFSLIMP